MQMAQNGTERHQDHTQNDKTKKNARLGKNEQNEKKKKKSYDWETNRMSGRRLRNRALFFFLTEQ